MIGTIGNNGNVAGTIYKTKAGNYVDASSVDGRKTDIKQNADGTYDVKVDYKGKVDSYKNLSEAQLVEKYGADITKLDINLNGTTSQADAQSKYGEGVAKNFYAIA